MAKTANNPMRHIIAILRGVQPDEIGQVCSALVESGIGRIEITLNSPDPLHSIALAKKRVAGRALIGAGTVLSNKDVDDVFAAGGQFIVSPDCNPAVIGRTIELGLGSYPGVFTPTEAFLAIRYGATGLKIFPGELVGAAGIRAMKAVLPPEMPVYVVGGANPDNFSTYFEAGCSGFGLGSYLYKTGRSVHEVARRAELAVKSYDAGTKTE